MEAQPTPTQLLTVKEAAAVAHVCEKTIRRTIKAGRLQATQLTQGGAIRIHPAWLDAWIEDGRILGQAHMTAVPDRTYPQIRPKGQPRRGYLEIGDVS